MIKSSSSSFRFITFYVIQFFKTKLQSFVSIHMTFKVQRRSFILNYFLFSFSSNTQVVIFSLEVSQLVKRHLVLFPQQPHELVLMPNNTRRIFFFFIIWFFIIDIVTSLLTKSGLENEVQSIVQIQCIHCNDWKNCSLNTMCM